MNNIIPLKILIVIFATVTSGCATIVQGSKQSVHFNRQPSGATCLLRLSQNPAIQYTLFSS